ncbi:hypothetical protein [Scytonema sp. NUACC26]|uniref:hypothetical protein n=1 Tax=Scytonema sp. NUACC26 TaxID=3140176 RepID=UPI0034DB8A21
MLSMSPLIETVLWGLGVAIIILIGVGFYLLWQIALVAIGYKAKILCSGVFVSKRDSTPVKNEDLLVDNLSLLKYISSKIDYQEQSVTASFLGFIKRKAIFRSQLGCTLLSDRSQEQFYQQHNLANWLLFV